MKNQPTNKEKDAKDDQANMDINKIETPKTMMEGDVSGEVNDIYGRYAYMHRMQKEGKTFDEYLTVLKELCKTCGICDCMHDVLLKDQIINGIPDINL